MRIIQKTRRILIVMCAIICYTVNVIKKGSGEREEIPW